MTKIRESKYKRSRQLGVSIWGEDKDAFNKRKYRPGQHGTQPLKRSDYGTHLHAKQRLKSHYGRIRETQFANIFRAAAKERGNTGESFIGLLESRLDTIVYRLKLAPSIFMARQLVTHKHIKVNGRTINIPSIVIKAGDIIELTNKESLKNIAANSIKQSHREVPAYLSLEEGTLTGKFLKKPSISDVPYPFDPKINLVVEFYSR